MIKLTTILDEIRTTRPGIPDLSDWNQNDIDGDPLTFGTLKTLTSFECKILHDIGFEFAINTSYCYFRSIR